MIRSFAFSRRLEALSLVTYLYTVYSIHMSRRDASLEFCFLFFSEGYHISVKIERGLMRKELSKKVEFIGEKSCRALSGRQGLWGKLYG